MIYAVYDSNTGQIKQTMQSLIEGDVALVCHLMGVSYLEVEDYSVFDKYIKDGEITLRPESPAELNELTLNDIPVGSSLYINNQGPYEITDDHVDFDFPDIGIYEIKLVGFPYLDKVFTITV